MEGSQVEGMERGEQVVEYVSLYAFVVNPACILDENVNLNGYSFFGRRELADKKSHFFLVDGWIRTEVRKTISPEGSEVGQVSLVEREMFI